MAEYVCSNCADKSINEGFSVLYIMTSCEDEQCDFEPHVNTNYIEILKDKADVNLIPKFSNTFADKYF